MPGRVAPRVHRRAAAMRAAIRPLLLPTLLALASREARTQGGPAELHAEFLLGTAWSLPTPLTVRLPDAPPQRVRARYDTRPWADAPYYAYRAGGGRLGRRGAPSGWEAELLHHKLYLRDPPPPPIERFEVTHGYNLTTVNVVRPAGGLAVRVGLGLTIAHPEGRIAGRGFVRRTFLGGGYHIAGLTGQLAVGRRYALGRGRTAAYLVPEAKLTASLARVPLGDDGATVLVPNVAAHALAGVGVRRLGR